MDTPVDTVDASLGGLSGLDVRTMSLTAHEVTRWFYSFKPRSRDYGQPCQVAAEIACMIFYADRHPRTGRKRRLIMPNLDQFALDWKSLILRLSTAHDKDAADRAEADVEKLLTPVLTMPVRQLRELGPKVLALLKADPLVPWLVWRAYEVWIEQMATAPDGDVKELKTDLARQITAMVEGDLAPQLPDALVRALQWRPESALLATKAIIERGEKPRLRGRESCLFMEIGGTEDHPEVCIQI